MQEFLKNIKKKNDPNAQTVKRKMPIWMRQHKTCAILGGPFFSSCFSFESDKTTVKWW